MKTLVLAEKPSVGKDIGRVLQCTRGGQGYVEGPQHIVTWALGHLVTLADPEKYNKAFKSWNMDHLPIMPEKTELVIIKESSKQYGVVKDLLHRKDVGTIVIATDAGREGELVARWILEKSGCRKPVKRLWISSVTDKAIREGFRNLKDGKETVNLGESAKARAEADWLVGINATRCLTTKFNSQLSCGRVQTPTVAIINKREEEIRGFQPQKYYGLSAAVEKFSLTWVDGKSGSTRSFDQSKMDALLSGLKTSREATIIDLNKVIKKMMPPKLYDLTELQRDASKRYGYSPKETLSIMQRLYEQHKVLTYPRTDSRYISTDIVPTLKERLRACAVPPYAKICNSLLMRPIKADSNFVDDKKVSDHHAIIPTEQPLDLNDLNDRERKIFDLVMMRFLVVLHPPCLYEQVTVKAKIGTETFTARGKTVTSLGFKAIGKDWGDDEDDEAQDEAQGVKEQTLPPLQKGAKLPIRSIVMTEGKTKPPAPFNDATLLSAMENPAKYMETSDKTLAKTLGETGGLGTVATRADVIEKLFDTFYIEKKGKDIFTTSKGRQLLKLAPKDLRSPEMTGQWEQKLSQIAQGRLKKEAFLRDIRTYTANIVKEIKDSAETFRHDNLSTTKCPECGKFMLEVNGKKGKMLVCQDRECNTRKHLSTITNARCEQCHKRLEIMGEGERRTVVCACGYREKYDSFAKRKEAQRDQPSKKDVQNYIHKINSQNTKQVPNKAIADALKGLKF